MELTNHTHHVYVNGIRYADPYTALLAVIAAEDRYLRSKRAGKWTPKIQWFRTSWNRDGVACSIEELKGLAKPAVKVTDGWVMINLRACKDFLTAAQYIRQQMNKYGQLSVSAIYIDAPIVVREVCGLTGQVLTETLASQGPREWRSSEDLIRFRNVLGTPIAAGVSAIGLKR